MALVLASKSPRRRELMNLITPYFTPDEAGIDEKGIAGEGPAGLAANIAAAKARAVAALRPADTIVGCDTVVELDGVALGKPAGVAEAADMLRRLAGRWHKVHTAVCVILPADGAATAREIQFVETTEVEFADIPEEELLAYAATPDPLDKAGAYGIQGWASRYIPRIRGCYYNVMGLPVSALYRALSGLGRL